MDNNNENLPPKPEYGEYQTAEWDDGYGFWRIRDLTPEEIAVKFPSPEPGPLTANDVIAERQRRLALGFTYDFGDARGIHEIGTTPPDMKGWDEVTQGAMARHALGSTTPISIVTNTGPVEVTPAEWLAILNAATAFRQPIWHASFILQAMDPIPADYADGKHWPQSYSQE